MQIKIKMTLIYIKIKIKMTLIYNIHQLNMRHLTHILYHSQNFYIDLGI